MALRIHDPRLRVRSPMGRVPATARAGPGEPGAWGEHERDRARARRRGGGGGRAGDVGDEHERDPIGLGPGGRAQGRPESGEPRPVPFRHDVGSSKDLREAGLRLGRKVAHEVDSVDGRVAQGPDAQHPLPGRHGQRERVLVRPFGGEFPRTIRGPVDGPRDDRPRHVSARRAA